MIPGMNPKDVAKAMKRMGVKQDEIEAEQVIIKCKDKDILFEQPQVAKINMMGQESWQITGKAIEQERNTTPDIKEEDINTVMEQTGKSKEEVVAALEETKGDLAEAILKLSE